MNAGLPSVAPSTLEQAADWFALRRSGEMTAQMLFELEVWLESDPAHLAAYRSVARTWALTQAVATDPELLALREEARGRNNARRRTVIAGVALCTAATFALVVWLFNGIAVWKDMVSPISDQHFRTAVGETRSVILSDGSAVTLDSDTELDVHETWRARSLALGRGQGFFLVAKDPDRPFTVLAAGSTVTATGTAFNVRVDPGRLTVLLAEGRLHVDIPETSTQSSEATDMEPGWQLTAITGGDRTMAKLSLQSEDRALSWRSGQLAFVGQPVASIAAELNRYSNKKILVTPDLGVVAIDGVFREGDTDGFVRLLVADGLARVENNTDRAISLVSRKKTSSSPRR